MWGRTARGQLLKIQKLINFAARIVTGLKKHDHITQALGHLGWPRIETLVSHCDAVKVFKALREQRTPQEIREMFTLRSAVSARETRASGRGSLHLKKCRLIASQKAFSYRAATVWNSLPPQVCAAETMQPFKTTIKNSLTQRDSDEM